MRPASEKTKKQQHILAYVPGIKKKENSQSSKHLQALLDGGTTQILVRLLFISFSLLRFGGGRKNQ